VVLLVTFKIKLITFLPPLEIFSVFGMLCCGWPTQSVAVNSDSHYTDFV
jgi:hypothetical protein